MKRSQGESYQQMVDDASELKMRELLSFDNVVRSYLNRKLKGLSDEKIDILLESVKMQNLEDAPWATPSIRHVLNDMTDDRLNAHAVRLGKRAHISILRSFKDAALTEVIPELFRNIEEDEAEIYSALSRLDAEHRSHLRPFWGAPITALAVFVDHCRSIPSSIEQSVEYYRAKVDDSSAGDESDYQTKAFALNRVYDRAMKTAAEIVHLLKGGYSDGALARWRALHELATVASILGESPATISRRYLDHHVIDAFKKADLHRRYADEIGECALSEQECDTLRSAADEKVEMYGEKFKGAYGWAQPLFSATEHITFRKLENLAKLDHQTFHYKVSCEFIHAGSIGCFFSLGSFHEGSIVDSASLIGLEVAGRLTCQTLIHIAATRLTFVSTVDTLIMFELFRRLGERCVHLFEDAEDSIAASSVSDDDLKSWGVDLDGAASSPDRVSPT